MSLEYCPDCNHRFQSLWDIDHHQCPKRNSSGAERSEVPKGCPPSASGSSHSLAAERPQEAARSEAIDPAKPAEQLGSFVAQSEPPGTEVLLACPFCGFAPYIEQNKVGVWKIACLNFYCLVSVEVEFVDKKEAIYHWNTRAGDPTRNPGGAPPCGERDCATNSD